MTPRALLHNGAMCRGLLYAASLLVPIADRSEWREEWLAELWHLLQERGLKHALHGSEEATAFCVGAFADALWMRRNRCTPVRMQVPRAGAAARCVLSLALGAFTALLLCLALPGAHRALAPLPYQRDASLLAITRGGYAGMQRPTVQLADYLVWQTSAHGLLSEVAFYEPAPAHIRVAELPAATLTIARASDNLFHLLQLSTDADPAAQSGLPRLLIGERVWRRDFAGDPAIVGQVAFINGRGARIAGVLSEDAWRLPGDVDAWLLESDAALSRRAAGSTGFVLARMRSDAFPADDWRTMTVPRADDKIETFDCISIAQQTRRPWSTFLFALFLACLALPATTPLPLGSYPPHSGQLSRSVRARRWVFLAAKLALLVPLVSLFSFDLAYGIAPRNAIAALYLQLATSFFGFLFAFRWALRDQRMRCPVCLALLSNPARVGHASCNFLAWHGTELICARGHGMLHIPDLQTSWFSTQRWLYLDASWRSVFAEAWATPVGGAT